MSALANMKISFNSVSVISQPVPKSTSESFKATLRPAAIRTSNRNFQSSQLRGAVAPYRIDTRIRHRLIAFKPQILLTYTGFMFQAGGDGDIDASGDRNNLEVWLYDATGGRVQARCGGDTNVDVIKGGIVKLLADISSLEISNAQPYLWEQTSYERSNAPFDGPLPLVGNFGEYCVVRELHSSASAAGIAPGEPGALKGIANQGWGASAIEAIHDGITFLLLGHSIADGAGGDSTGGETDLPGWPARALNYEFGTLRITCPQASLTAMANASKNLALTGGQIKYAIIEGITNDIFGGATLQTIQARLTRTISRVKKNGVRYCLVATVLPATESYDGWRSLENQSTRKHEKTRLAVNAWLLTRPLQSDGIIDLTSFETADSHWPLINGLPATHDGTHPNSLASKVISDIARPQIMDFIRAKESLGEGTGGTGMLP